MPASVMQPGPTAVGEPAWTRRELAVLFGITLLAAGLRLFRIELWSWSGNEAATWRLITAPLQGDGGLFAGVEGLSPLAFLSLRWLCDSGILPGHGEGWLRLPFAFAGVLAVPLLVLLGRPLVGSGPALLAGLLLAVHPAHVAVSQSTAPVAIALAVALAGFVCLQQGVSWLAIVVLAIAGLAAPIAWTGLAALLVLRLPAGARDPFWRCLTLLAAALLPWGLTVLGWPLVVAAAVGSCLLPRSPLHLATTLPFVVAMAAALATGAERRELLVAALPGLALSGALGLQRAFVAARAQLRGSPPSVAVGAALPAVVVVTCLAVDVFLYLTVFRGGRPPWRHAAEVVSAATNDRGGFVVGAGAGAGPLACYLRPNHWREPAVDAHPGVAVQALDLGAPAAALAALAARTEPRVLLVLGDDEVDALAGPVREQLAAVFELLRVVPAPQAHGDDTVYVYRCTTAR